MMKPWRPYILIGMYVSVGLGMIIACQQAPDIPTIPTDYRSWRMTTETALNYPVPGHEDHFRKIYINPTGEKFTRTVTNNRVFCKFPEGTIIIKEIYAGLEEPGSQENPVTLTVMMKDAEHPEARGGWVWLAQNYATKETNVLDYELCVDCHANANERHPYGDGNPDQEFRDYVYFPPVQSASPPQHTPSASEGYTY